MSAASPSKSALTMSAMDWFLLVVLSLLWGGAFYFAKVAVLEIPPLTLALGRVGIAAAALAILTRIWGAPFPRDAATWRLLAVMAVLNNVIPFSLTFWGQIHISVGLVSILNATTPLFGMLVAHFWTRDDKLSAGRALGLVAGFVGVVVLIGPDLLHDFGTHALAELACLLASCFYAFGAVYTRRLRALSPLVVATGQMSVSALLLIPIVLVFDRPSAVLTASAAAIWAMLALALLSSSLGHLIYFRVLGRAGATNTLLVAFMIPVSAILLGMFLLSETPDAHQIAGMAAVFIGLAAIDGRPARSIARWVRH